MFTNPAALYTHFPCRMQLAVNAQFPKELGGLGSKVLYIGKSQVLQPGT
jgi:hypothetical protein